MNSDRTSRLRFDAKLWNVVQWAKLLDRAIPKTVAHSERQNVLLIPTRPLALRWKSYHISALGRTASPVRPVVEPALALQILYRQLPETSGSSKSPERCAYKPPHPEMHICRIEVLR
jgi:hypothetical protein